MGNIITKENLFKQKRWDEDKVDEYIIDYTTVINDKLLEGYRNKLKEVEITIVRCGNLEQAIAVEKVYEEVISIGYWGKLSVKNTTSKYTPVRSCDHWVINVELEDEETEETEETEQQRYPTGKKVFVRLLNNGGFYCEQVNKYVGKVLEATVVDCFDFANSGIGFDVFIPNYRTLFFYSSEVLVVEEGK